MAQNASHNLSGTFDQQAHNTDPNKALSRVAREVLIHAVGTHTGQSYGLMFTDTDYAAMKAAKSALEDALIESGVARSRDEFMVTIRDTSQARKKAFRGELHLLMPRGMNEEEQRKRYTAGYAWVARQSTPSGLDAQIVKAHERIKQREEAMAATRARLLPILQKGMKNHA